MAKNEHHGVGRDTAGIGPHIRPGVRLIPLRDHERLQIAEGEPDVRGWEVRTVSGREIGKVDDLLVDATVDEIVMLLIDLPGTDRHSLAPIRAAQIDRARRVVLLDSAELRDERDVPSLARGGPLTAEEVRAFGEGYGRAYGERGFAADRDYSVRRGEEELRFGRRTDEALDQESERDIQRDADRAAERAAAEREVSLRRVENEEVAAAEQRDEAERRLRYAAGTSGASGTSGAGAVEERVVERRPVVVEEVVVRRRTVDPDSPEAREATTQRPEERP